MMTDNERIDDLQRNGYKIIQNKECFCFGMDAVLLSSFAKADEGNRVLDLCTGNGIIPILMFAKNPGTSYCGLEIQKTGADLAQRSVKLNGLEDKIKIINDDVKEASRIFGGASFNVVTVNPPYMNESHGIVNPESAKAIARHEILCTLEDVISQAARCLKVKGHFYMVHRPSRLAEIVRTMSEYKLEPKRIRMVHPYINKDANMVLIEGVKGANTFMKIESPLIVYNQDGSYTDELLKMY